MSNKNDSIDLPIEPFQDWLKERLASGAYRSIQDFATSHHISDKRIREWLSPSARFIREETVDKILCEDGTVTLIMVWPDIYEKYAA